MESSSCNLDCVGPISQGCLEIIQVVGELIRGDLNCSPTIFVE